MGLTALLFLAPNGVAPILSITACIAMWLMAEAWQEPALQAHVWAGGCRESYWKAAGIGVGVMLLLLFLVFVAIILLGSASAR